MLDRPTFSTSEVAAAAGIPEKTLQTWLNRDDIWLCEKQVSDREREEIKKPGTGISRRFTLRRAMQIALTAELTRFGYSPRPASMAAAKFTDTGHGAAAWGNEEPKIQRNVGGLYPNGTTVLCIAKFENGVDEYEVTPFEAISESGFQIGNKSARGLLLIDLNALDYRVRKALNVE